MKIKGIKRGKTIELLEWIDIADVNEIVIEIPDEQFLKNNAPKLQRLHQVFCAWKDDPEITEIFSEIDEKRHKYMGRETESFDN